MGQRFGSVIEPRHPLSSRAVVSMRNPISLLRFALVALSVLVATSAWAADGFDAQTFHPLPSQRTNFWSVSSARIPAHLEWEGGLVLNYAKSPVVERDADDEVIHEPVASMVTMNLLGSLGLTGSFDIGLDLPLHLVQNGDAAPADTEFLDTDGGFGLGDLRLVPRYRFYSTGEPNGGGLHLAGQLGLALPTGDAERLQGGGFQVAPRFIVEAAVPQGSRVAANVGYLMRPSTVTEGLEVDDAVTWGFAYDVLVEGGFSFIGEATGEVAVSSAEGGTERHPIELLLGGEWSVTDELHAGAAFGRGFSRGVGAPEFRFVLAVSYGMATNLDRDGDELLNSQEFCPDAAEDFDEFADDDGCPDNDNDQDGVDDRSDECPLQAEDIDGFEDEDGCPELDNDGDELADEDDECPEEVEDFDLFEDEDGCPELDNDEDGIEDVVDDCPQEAEDTDGFEDDDGCPEPDNDDDGLLDADDACPGEAEVVNGVDDADGCPEESRVSLNLETGAVDAAPIAFDGISSNLTLDSMTTLAELAVALAAYPDRMLRIVVHAQDRGNDIARVAIAERRCRSIREGLMLRGVAVERMQITGYAIPGGAPGGPIRVELRLGN